MSFSTYIYRIAGLLVAGLVAVLSLPYLPHFSDLSPGLVAFVADFPIPDFALLAPFFLTAPDQEWDVEADGAPFVCDTSHRYKTTLVSLDPLLVYIHGLLTTTETAALLRAAEPSFAPSEVTKNGRDQRTGDRTSSSAGLPRNDPAVMCVLARAREFMGTMLRDDWDEMGAVQLVRYRSGQRFNTHFDWYDIPRWANDGSLRKWNRIASFFVVLQDNCTGGETYFPRIKGITPPSPQGEPLWDGRKIVDQDDMDNGEASETQDVLPLWREHEDGGLAFRPVAGNGVFWINLFPNGTGDRRTLHAGLPLVDGMKTAMNIWPRQYYPYD